MTEEQDAAVEIIEQYERERGTAAAQHNAVVRITTYWELARLEGAVQALRDAAKEWSDELGVAWLTIRADLIRDRGRL